MNTSIIVKSIVKSRENTQQKRTPFQLKGVLKQIKKSRVCRWQLAGIMHTDIHLSPYSFASPPFSGFALSNGKFIYEIKDSNSNEPK